MIVSNMLLLSVCGILALASLPARGDAPNPVRFVGIRDFASWTRTPGDSARQTALTSPTIESGIPWDELVVSWNATTPPGTGLRVEGRAIYPDHATRFYTLGIWSSDPGVKAFDKNGAPASHPRESLNGQKDSDGDVQTDTLVLKRPATKVEVRITLDGREAAVPSLRFLGLSFLNSAAAKTSPPAPARRRVWGMEIDVPERAQGNYEHGSVICSPTCTSMTLSYWARAIKRPDMDRDVPDVVEGVYDRAYGGTGNWPFNTAYAASFPGMRAYVTRFTSLSELEGWIEASIPVVCSVSYYLLRGRPLTEAENGHLVICVGFTKEGDVILNDPALNPKRGLRVRTTIPRKQFEAAWAHSRHTVYLIYPESHRTPANRLHHWDH